MNFLKNAGTRMAVVGSTLVGGAVSPVLAAVPTTVSTALGDAATDTLVVAGLVLAIIIGITAFKYFRSAIK